MLRFLSLNSCASPACRNLVLRVSSYARPTLNPDEVSMAPYHTHINHNESVVVQAFSLKTRPIKHR